MKLHVFTLCMSGDPEPLAKLLFHVLRVFSLVWHLHAGVFPSSDHRFVWLQTAVFVPTGQRICRHCDMNIDAGENF